MKNHNLYKWFRDFIIMPLTNLLIGFRKIAFPTPDEIYDSRGYPLDGWNRRIQRYEDCSMMLSAGRYCITFLILGMLACSGKSLENYVSASESPDILATE